MPPIVNAKPARLCLVDGTYELFRAFYGAPSRVSQTGQEIGAAMALGRSLSSLARRGEFSHFAVAFDTVIESFRNDLFDGYKTGEGIEPALFSQFGLAEQLVSALGFVVLSMVEFEADDALATLAARFENATEFDGIVIASPDKDLMQCVRGTRIITWDRMRDLRYDEAAVVEKMGVAPLSVPDYLALVGDSADGIPGLAGFGAKGSAALLGSYLHLEAIPADAAGWLPRVRGAAGLARTLCESREAALLYRKLATLRRDVPLPHQAEDLRYVGPDHPRLVALAAGLGEPRLLEFERPTDVVPSSQ